MLSLGHMKTGEHGSYTQGEVEITRHGLQNKTESDEATTNLTVHDSTGSWQPLTSIITSTVETQRVRPHPTTCHMFISSAVPMFFYFSPLWVLSVAPPLPLGCDTTSLLFASTWCVHVCSHLMWPKNMSNYKHPARALNPCVPPRAVPRRLHQSTNIPAFCVVFMVFILQFWPSLFLLFFFSSHISKLSACY